MDKPDLFTTRQVAHALGIRPEALNNMRLNGLANPVFRTPGARGGYWYTGDEIRRLLSTGEPRKRVYRARRRKTPAYPLDGLVIYKPRAPGKSPR